MIQPAFTYKANVGMFGKVLAGHDYDDNSYIFSFFNGIDITPLRLSSEAAFYTWLFLSMMHPECSFNATKMQNNFVPSKTKKKTTKKAGCSPKTKKRPSLTKNKK